MKSSTRSALMLLGFIAITFAVAAFGGQFGPGAWYAGLRKPSWNPPNWIFAPVWTLLYLLMATAAWLVWRSEAKERRVSLALYFVQLALNGLWSWIFFGLQNPGAAFVDIVALWLAIVLTIAAFRPVRPLAAGLLLPYLAWVTFASALNLALWRMNA